MLKTHVAIYITSNNNKQLLLNNILSGELLPNLKPLKGAVFSEYVINKHIDLERRYGHVFITAANKNSLAHASEGERKKALLQHIISNKPEYIIADNIYGNLDVETQKNIKLLFHKLNKSTIIIQITNRLQDVLSFIDTVFQFSENTLKPLIHTEDEKNTKNYFINTLPKPHKPIVLQTKTLVKFENVSVAYFDRMIIKNINWEINQGEFWHLKGANGSGKSTILSLISGDNPKAYNQNIYLFGNKKGSGESVWDIKKQIGFFGFDMLRGFKKHESIENMILSGFYDSVGLYKHPNESEIAIAQQWLALLGMKSIKSKSFQTLSSGHKRLVLIARAMVKHPPLLILDEPTNGLDDTDALMFTSLINKIATETNTAILYVSHREEAGLKPDFIYQLSPSKTGSTGKQII
ncbi:ATP-binding cassette domain-containing protein [Seonamhaeicola algicola]|uniref:ATP-binding cassette domain-containing protein n=1 Tax=Seonamhaeicola algicola TaxID=1719036 RepID=A0A5C7B2G7_9FLAO|nr:ATP-binding cassette domain-containing protein [Seonamhaeicola algicola]TXE15088.1 ATP-binding cassette domain-containing protein [Seonamhaeicola algicola]